MDYDKEDYNQFLRYIQSTWSQLFDNDWLQEPKIDSIIIDLSENKFTVCVSLKDNSYYKFDNGHFTGNLIIEKYDPSKYIKTEYDLNNELILYMLINGDIINDLGLKDVEININPYWISYIPIDEYLSKQLEKCQEDYAETMYCIMHDL